MELVDVIICGGGPAGSTCALALANSGLKVVVIEKGSFPREKMCGDLVAPYIPKVLHAIDPKYKDALSAFTYKDTISTRRIVGPNNKYIDIPLRENAFIAKRGDWDNFLYKLASAESNIHYQLNQQVVDVTVNQTLQEVIVTTDKTSFKGKLVIGCDGANSVVGKKLTSTTHDAKHYAIAVRGYYQNVKDIPAATYELHFIKGVLPGYLWIFPFGNNTANVGLGVSSHLAAKRKLNLRTALEDILKNNPHLQARFKDAELIGKIEGGGLPLGSRKTVISGNHFMLCGDAASLIDPATGEGIGHAMISGRYAGWQAVKCFEANDFSAPFMQQYDKQVYDKLWGKSRMNYLYQRIILNNARLFNFTVKIFKKSTFLLKLVLGKNY